VSKVLSEQVIKPGLCAGCGLCVSVAGGDQARMQLDPHGFYRPSFDRPLTEAENAALLKACPGATLDLQATDTPVHPLWGPIRDQWIAHATDEEMRFKASSGGALSAAVTYMLEHGLADYVLHNGADPANPILNRVIESAHRAEVVSGAGSRYGPSAPLQEIDARLSEGRRFVFVGKPCDVAALRMYARQDSRVDRSVVLMIAFMCAGVPNISGTRQVLDALGVSERELAAFRYRGHGWPGFATATRHDGSMETMPYETSWGSILTHHRQKRCKICPDGTGFFADLTFGDGWELDAAGAPTFDEKPGQSLVLTRTAKGEEIFAQSVASGYVSARSIERVRLERIQPYQAKRTRLTASRQLALMALNQPRPRYRGMKLFAAATGAGILSNLRSFAGTVLRVVQKRF